MELSYFFWT